MAKALMGTYTTPRAVELLEEVRALRSRVAHLEAELEVAQRLAEERAAEISAADASEPPDDPVVLDSDDEPVRSR